MEKYIELVKEHIKGTRKGSDEPNYQHSIRVYESLRDSGSSEGIQLAGLLHDILEDSKLTKENLLDMGIHESIVDLIIACSHDDDIGDSFERWKSMMDKIEESDNKPALIIKIADLTDNMTSCHLLKPTRYNNFMEKKSPYLMEIMERMLDMDTFTNTAVYHNLFNTYRDQLVRIKKKEKALLKGK